MPRYACVALGASLITFVASSAAAQSTGFAVNQFDPAERGSEWFALESLDLRGHLRPAIGIVADWAYRPLVETDENGNVLHSIVRNEIVLHPGASLVLWDRLRLGLDVPVQVLADGNAAQLGAVAYPPPENSTSLGDIRLGLDTRLFGTYGGPITGALGAQIYLPTGNQPSYASDGSTRVAPRALIAGDLGPFVYAAKIGVTIRGLDTSYGGVQVGNDIFFGASAGLRLASRALVIGPEVFGSSVLVHGAFLTKGATPVEGMVGAHYTIADAVRIGAGISTGLTEGYGTPQRRGVFSLEWTPGIPPSDRDRDGVLDVDDACPDVFGVATNEPTTNGCPAPPPADRDGDGILDASDACPDVPGVKTDDPTTNGCPSDRDGDGIADGVDACPDVAGVRTDDPKTNGCPGDRDHDGVLDKDDACPDVPGLKTTDPKTNGCPNPDRDHDGIPNDQDACPDVAGKPDPDPKRNGCPKAFVDQGKIKILDQVKFKTGTAVITGKDSDDVLQAVLGVLADHPEIKKLKIEGHTDNVGAHPMNMRLSAARATSVVKWLVGHGIAASRLDSEGFGPDRPIETNETDAGRQSNRRVEFQIEQ